MAFIYWSFIYWSISSVSGFLNSHSTWMEKAEKKRTRNLLDRILKLDVAQGPFPNQSSPSALVSLLLAGIFHQQQRVAGGALRWRNKWEAEMEGGEPWEALKSSFLLSIWRFLVLLETLGKAAWVINAQCSGPFPTVLAMSVLRTLGIFTGSRYLC